MIIVLVFQCTSLKNDEIDYVIEKCLERVLKKLILGTAQIGMNYVNNFAGKSK